MIFHSEHKIAVPAVDVLTYIFGTPAQAGDTPVFVNSEDATQSLSKSDFEVYIKRLAGGLQRTLCIRDSDVVLAYTDNSILYPVIVLGAICAGGIFTGANPAYTVTELINQLTISGARCIFTDTRRLANALQAADAFGMPRSSIVLVDHDGKPATGGPLQISNLLAEEYAWEVINDEGVLDEKVVVLNFSSGTTGNPKACMITHRNLVANAEQTSHLDRMARERTANPNFALYDVHCAFLPLYHASGLLTYCVLNVRRSCTTVIMPKFSLDKLLRTIDQFRVTYLFLAPPVVVMLLKSSLLPHYDVSSVRFLLSGGAPLPPILSKTLEGIFRGGNARSRQGWGMTEATMAVCLFAPDEFDPTHESVGYLLPNIELKIIGHDGREVGYNEEGEALIRGPNVFRGFYRNPSASQQAQDVDGWLKTGDIVMIKESGLLTIVDRKKELIKVKGFQVSPSELEGHLLEHEGIRDCAVIRVRRNGREHPQAHIVPSSKHVTADSITAFMERRLSTHKRLTGGIIFTDVIPKSPSGKILRRMLKDPASAGPAHL